MFYWRFIYNRISTTYEAIVCQFLEKSFHYCVREQAITKLAMSLEHNYSLHCFHNNDLHAYLSAMQIDHSIFMLFVPPAYQVMDMDQENRNNSQTTKDKLPNNLKRLIESLSAHVPPLLANSHEVTKIASINGQIPLPAIAANEISGISDSSHDSSINSIGYVADTSELNQPDNGSPAKIPPTSQGSILPFFLLFYCFIFSCSSYTNH